MAMSRPPATLNRATVFWVLSAVSLVALGILYAVTAPQPGLPPFVPMAVGAVVLIAAVWPRYGIATLRIDEARIAAQRILLIGLAGLVTLGLIGVAIAGASPPVYRLSGATVVLEIAAVHQMWMPEVNGYLRELRAAVAKEWYE